MLKARDLKIAKHAITTDKSDEPDREALVELLKFDADAILAYSEGDLHRALRDLNEAFENVGDLLIVLDPGFRLAPVGRAFEEKPELMRVAALRALSGRRLLGQALRRIRGHQKSTPQAPP